MGSVIGDMPKTIDGKHRLKLTAAVTRQLTWLHHEWTG
jgi:hypothetical protein